jgi:hypothetical protein
MSRLADAVLPATPTILRWRVSTCTLCPNRSGYPA